MSSSNAINTIKRLIKCESAVRLCCYSYSNYCFESDGNLMLSAANDVSDEGVLSPGRKAQKRHQNGMHKPMWKFGSLAV